MIGGKASVHGSGAA